MKNGEKFHFTELLPTFYVRLQCVIPFTFAGKIVKAGYKFGRWLDLVFYQKLLDGPKQPVGE